MDAVHHTHHMHTRSPLPSPHIKPPQGSLEHVRAWGVVQLAGVTAAAGAAEGSAGSALAAGVALQVGSCAACVTPYVMLSISSHGAGTQSSPRVRIACVHRQLLALALQPESTLKVHSTKAQSHPLPIFHVPCTVLCGPQ